MTLRFLGLLTLSLWVGGFTFYSAFVIPVLHEALGSVNAGYITQDVTDTLNLIGLAAVAAWWVLAVVERRAGTAGFRRARLGLLTVTTALLAFLIILHRVMDRRLDAGSLRGFYPLHRAYLLASTAQWAANVGLLFVALWGAGHSPDAGTGVAPTFRHVHDHPTPAEGPSGPRH